MGWEGKDPAKGRLVPGLQIKAGGEQQLQAGSSQHLLLRHSQVKHIIPTDALLNGFCGETFTGSMTASADAPRNGLQTHKGFLILAAYTG